MAITDAVVKRGDIVVDVGANFGLYTDRLARVVGPGGRVYAFEPHHGYNRTLARIAQRHGNIQLITSAASAQVGAATLSVPASDGRRIRAMGSLERRPSSPGGESLVISTTTLDAELRNVSGIRFVKCDVEGHEHEVLLGARDLLHRARPILLIEIEQRHRERPIGETFGLLRELMYDGYMLTENGARPLSEFDVRRDQLDVLIGDLRTGAPPVQYVHDFVFLPQGMPLAALAPSGQ